MRNIFQVSAMKNEYFPQVMSFIGSLLYGLEWNIYKEKCLATVENSNDHID